MRLLLQAELERRKSRNAAYSLRAFAQQLGMSPASLSQLIAGKRILTARTAALITQRLNLDPDAAKAVQRAVPRRVLVVEGQQVAGGPSERDEPAVLEVEAFRVIADWYHYAILSLATLPEHEATPEWIAGRLGITKTEARTALARLRRVGLLEIKKGRMRATQRTLETTTDVASTAIRKFHKQTLERAQRALDDVPVELREFAALTIGVDPENLPRAKETIRRFKSKMAALLDPGRKARVYQLGIQLFPLDKE